MRDQPTLQELQALATPDAPAAALALARAIIAREQRAGSAPVAAWAARLAALYPGDGAAPDALERRLAGELRAGALDGGPRRGAVRGHLIATVRAKLAEIDPAAIETWALLSEGADR
jgi:hypothetical protein